MITNASMMMDIKTLSSPEPGNLSTDSISCCRYNLRNRGSTMFTVLTESECPICLSDVFDKPVVVNCGHTFCGKCIRTTMAKYKNCPMCNQVLIEPLFLSDLRFTRKLTNKLQSQSSTETKIQSCKVVLNRSCKSNMPQQKPKSVNNQKKSAPKSKKSRNIQ
ncbi:probable E3 ubiquitin protein ligase DRIPH [Aedes aegypti]|uniref:RING-type domain-containing protein n=1 Tax=Aedes aegypti TaxID=7159 RepID=A0A6I8TME0_AEDAE|nr:probable E3 ubiquitin protein ligase DRIPH [Aedes aegypti]